MKCLCNTDLLRASVARARGVVARRVGDEAAAIHFFDLAQQAAKTALDSLNKAPQSDLDFVSIALAYDETPHRVLADVYYSYGYYWYERGNYARARQLFEKSIEAVSQSNQDVDWDSPYTRLAILNLIEGDDEAALKSALTARGICGNTQPGRNREAALSLAIITLTLRILERKLGRTLIDPRANVDRELDTALQANPALGLGPIECHRKDAELLGTVGTDAAELADPIITRLSMAADSMYRQG